MPVVSRPVPAKDGIPVPVQHYPVGLFGWSGPRLPQVLLFKTNKKVRSGDEKLITEGLIGGGGGKHFFLSTL